LNGCRPGEACSVRRCDIDTGEPLWLYRPPHHKTAYRGRVRTIILGPRAQELVKDYFTPVMSDYLFSPVRASEERRAERSAERKSKRTPYQVARDTARRASSRQHFREKYDRESYGLAIDRACDQAFPPHGNLARQDNETNTAWWGRLTVPEREAVKAWRKVHRWHPNQLRHSFATRVRKQHGLEAAQVLLGHSLADVTQVYAERNEELAAKVAAKIG
jgi:integrase